MEFPIESILETVLVGSIVGLSFLSLTFLFLGHVFRVDSLRRLAKFALYEADLAPSYEAVPASRKEEEKRFAFGWMVMIATLYGLGVITESLSHAEMRDGRFKDIAFAKVGRGQVTSGTAPPDFVRLMTDLTACESVGIGREDSGPCGTLYNRRDEFYYNAKNVVMKDHTFATELSKLEARINFVRSAFVAIGILTIETGLAFVFAAGVEIFFRLTRRRRLTPALERRAEEPGGSLSLVDHWKNLDAKRCAAMTIVLAGVTWGAYEGWKGSEIQFDNRVFGYYLSSHKHDQEEAKDVIPESTYEVFSLGTGRHFEPSAVSVVGSTWVLVANDKGGAEPFDLFRLTRVSDLEDPVVVKESVREGAPSVFKDLGKVEAFFTYDDDARKTHVVVATPAIAGGVRLTDLEIVSLPTIDPGPGASSAGAPPAAERSTHDEEEGPSPPTTRSPPSTARYTGDAVMKDTDQTQVIPDLCHAAGVATSDEPGPCFIEGVTSRDWKKELFLGVRAVGQQDPGRRRPVVAIVRLIKVDSRWVNPQRLPLDSLDRFDKRDRLGKLDQRHVDCSALAGVSDLDVRNSDLLVLTSVEIRPGEFCGDKAQRSEAESARVRGDLWTIALPAIDAPITGHLEWRRMQTFAHKPEGVTRLPDEGRLLVVFDDDASRKSFRGAPKTFALEQDESVFAMLPGSEPKPENAGDRPLPSGE